MAVPQKLPRRYYKKVSPVKVRKFQQKSRKESTLVLFDRRPVAGWKQIGFNRFISGRKTAIANSFGQDLLDILRLTHMQATMHNWSHFRSQGKLTPEVAIIVDGSVQRKITHVQVFGQIIIQEPADNRTMYAAVKKALFMCQRYTRVLSGDLLSNYHVFLNNSVHIDPNLFMDEDAGWSRLDQALSSFQDDVTPFFTIVNTMPYAAKQERLHLPAGVMYQAWKDLWSLYGGELALRFRYYTDESLPIAEFQGTDKWYKRVTRTQGRGRKAKATHARTAQRYEAGKPLSFPAINIGQPGAFNSGASPVIRKAAAKQAAFNRR